MKNEIEFLIEKLSISSKEKAEYYKNKYAEIISKPKEKKSDKGVWFECIDQDTDGDFTEGKKYKCLNDNLEAPGSFIDNKGDENGWCGTNYKHFKRVEDYKPEKESNKLYGTTKGDAIVVTKEISGYNGNNDWCYIAIKDGSNYRYLYYNHDFCIDLEKITHRKATQEEIDWYYANGEKPFNINDIKNSKEWAIGTYGVIVSDFGDEQFPLGYVDKIENHDGNGMVMFEDYKSYCHGNESYQKHEFKWFATLEEAKEFSKSLLNKKESKSLKVEDLIKYNYYRLYYPSDNGKISGIVRFKSVNEHGCIKTTSNLYSACTKFSKENVWGSNYNKIEPSTEEEIRWLEVCSKAGMFMSKEEALKESQDDYKVGDWVVITKSNKNWHPNMDKFDRQIVQLTHVNKIYDGIEVGFKGCGSWTWRLGDKHFRKATQEEIDRVKKAEEVISKHYNNDIGIKAYIAGLDALTSSSSSVIGHPASYIGGGESILKTADFHSMYPLTPEESFLLPKPKEQELANIEKYFPTIKELE